MKFDVPSDFCDLPTDVKAASLKSAENALREQKAVFFKGKQFTNFDELTSHLDKLCKTIVTDPDWNGAMTEDMNG